MRKLQAIKSVSESLFGDFDINKTSGRADELNLEKEKLLKEMEEPKMPLPQISVEEAL